MYYIPYPCNRIIICDIYQNNNLFDLFAVCSHFVASLSESGRIPVSPDFAASSHAKGRWHVTIQSTHVLRRARWFGQTLAGRKGRNLIGPKATSIIDHDMSLGRKYYSHPAILGRIGCRIVYGPQVGFPDAKKQPKKGFGVLPPLYFSKYCTMPTLLAVLVSLMYVQ